MASTTTTASLSPAERHEILKFEMPECRIGDVVLWYPFGTPRDTPIPSVVIRKGNRSVSLQPLTRNVREDTVRHLDDPKLRLNVDQREGGAWRHTEEHILVEQLQRRIEHLEKKAGLSPSEVEVTYSPPTTEQLEGRGAKQYHALRKHALELGCEFEGNPKSSELKKMIAAKTEKPTETPPDKDA